jgi:hypothetical protein
MGNLKYIDKKYIFIPYLKAFPDGVALPNENNIIKVTDSEKKNLLKQKNGNNPCWLDIDSFDKEYSEE